MANRHNAHRLSFFWFVAMSMACLLEQCHRCEAATAEDVYRTALLQKQTIKNMRVDYKCEWKKVLNIPKVTAHRSAVPTRFRTVFDGNRRLFCQEPLSSRHVPVLALYDGNRTAQAQVVRRKDALFATCVFLQDGRGDIVEDFCIYTTVFMGIPLRERDIALASEGSWDFPDCIESMKKWRWKEYQVKQNREVVDGHFCLVLEAELDKLWVDESINCWYRKRERYENRDKPYLTDTTVLSDFRKNNDGVWLPMKIVRQERCPPMVPQHAGQVCFVTTLTVNSVEINCVTNDDYRLSLIPNARIEDLSKNTGFTLRKDFAGRIDELAAQIAELAPPTSRLPRPWVIYAAIVVPFLGLIAYAIQKRFYLRHQP